MDNSKFTGSQIYRTPLKWSMAYEGNELVWNNDKNYAAPALKYLV